MPEAPTTKRCSTGVAKIKKGQRRVQPSHQKNNAPPHGFRYAVERKNKKSVVPHKKWVYNVLMSSDTKPFSRSQTEVFFAGDLPLLRPLIHGHRRTGGAVRCQPDGSPLWVLRPCIAQETNTDPTIFTGDQAT